MSEKVYGWLLRLYPRRFRREYGDAMCQLFRDRVNAEHSTFGMVRLWFEIVRDLVVSVPRQHLERPSRIRETQEGYCLTEEAARLMVKRSHLQPLSAVALTITCGIAIGIAGDAPIGAVLAIYSPLFVPAFLSLRQTRRMTDDWLGYRLIVESDRVVLTRTSAQPVTILRSEISRLIETSGLGLAITTENPRHSIWAPSLLTGYADLCSALETWAPIERRERAFTPMLRSHFGFLWIYCAYTTAMVVFSPYLFAPLATVAVASLIVLMRQVKWKLVPALLLMGLLAKLVFLVRL